MVDDIFNPPKMAAACREYFSALTSAISSWTSGRSCENAEKKKDLLTDISALHDGLTNVHVNFLKSCQYGIAVP